VLWDSRRPPGPGARGASERESASRRLGRPLKVGREEMIGVWLAAEKYSRLDFAELDRQYASQAQYLANELKKFQACASASRRTTVPAVCIVSSRTGMRKTLGISRNDCEKRLLDGDPRIAILRSKGSLMFTLS